MHARLASWLVLAVLAAPLAGAEFGHYDDHGYPLDVEGRSTWPGVVSPLNNVAGTTVYPYYPILTAEVERLARDHPDLVKLTSIGKSTVGLDLWMLEIADFARIERGEGIPLEAREVVWVDGGTHSNEYSGVYFVAHLASFLLDEYETNETAKWIVENRHTWVLPMVNPDGSNAFGRLNARTVNINRNFPVDWGALSEDVVFNNPGPEPASEVETKQLIEWYNKTRPDYYASIHCCGNLWLYPYGVEGLDPVDNEMLARVCEEAFPTVREDCGPIWSTIYPASGSSVDTAYEYTGAVAFGYEMSGRGALALWGQPFTVDSVRTQEVESWNGVLHAFLNVHKYGAYPEIVSVTAASDALTVTLENTGYGNLTRGALVLTDAAGAERRADVPFLRAGERATVAIAGEIAPGTIPLKVEYAKRVMASPMGEVTLPLLVEKGTFGRLKVTIPEVPGALAPLSTHEAPAAAAPALAPLAALAAVAIVAALRRRG